MDKLVKLDESTHELLGTLADKWGARSRKEALSVMCRYFEQHPVNPYEARPLDVAEQLTKLKDTVISYHKTNEKRTNEQLTRQLGEVREMSDKAYQAATATVPASTFGQFAKMSLKQDQELKERLAASEAGVLAAIKSLATDLTHRTNILAGHVGQVQQQGKLKQAFLNILQSYFEERERQSGLFGASKERLQELQQQYREKVNGL